MPLFIYNNAYVPANNPKTLNDITDNIINSAEPEKIFLVLPTNKWIRAVEAKMINDYYKKWDKPSPKFNLFSFSSLIEFIAPELAKKSVTDSHQYAIFQDAIKKAKLEFYKGEKSDLPYQVSKKLFQIIKGLREDGMFAEDLAKDLLHGSQDENIEPRRLNDMCELSKTYEHLLSDNAFDQAELLRSAFNLFKINPMSIQERFKEHSQIFFFGFSKFKKPEINFLSLFANLNVQIAINFDYSPISGPLFSEYENLILDFQQIGFKRIIDLDDDYFEDLSKLNRSKFLRETLFRSEKIDKSKAFSDIIKIYEAKDKNHEIKSIVKLVKFLLANKNNNIKPADIAVVSRKADQYAVKFRDLFYSANIPAYISDRYHLSSAKPVLAIVAMLDLISNGYKSSDLNKIYQNNYIDLSKYKNRSIDIKLLLKLASKYKVFGGIKRLGLENWSNKFKLVLLKKEKLLIDDLYEDDFEKINLERETKELKQAMLELDKFSGLFPYYNQDMTPKEFKKFLYDLILEFDLREKIKESYNLLNNSKNQLTDIEYVYRFEFVEKNAQALRALIKEIDMFCEIIENVESTKQAKFTYYVNKFKATLSEAKYHIREKEGYGVTVTSFEQIRGINYPIVIFCGMNEGEFPIPFKADTFVGKEMKDSEANHYAGERTLFYQTLTNYTEELDKTESVKRIYLFYSKFGEDSEIARSQYIDELFRVMHLEKNINFFQIEEIEKYAENNLAQYDENNENAFVRALISASSLLSEHFKNPDSELFQTAVQHLKLENLTNIIKEKINESNKILHVGNRNTNNQSLSISQIEEYALCPYRYYVNRILKFAEEKKSELEISPQERGSIIHGIVRRFYEEMRDYQINVLGQKPEYISGAKSLFFVELDTNEREGYLKHLFAIAEEEIEKINNNEAFFEIDKMELLGSVSKKGILETWLDSELERKEKYWDYRPILFEFGFGISDNNEISAVKLSENLSLKGRIDRIDAKFINDGKELAIIICDYKNKKEFNKNNEIKNISDGRAFQMPLYLAAAKQIIQSEFHLPVRDDGAYYYSFTPQIDKDLATNICPSFFSTTFIEELIPNSVAYDLVKQCEAPTLINSSIMQADIIAQKIKEGVYPIEPQKDACKYCDYSAICRINELKIIENEEE